jgi:hypothetical protein
VSLAAFPPSSACLWSLFIAKMTTFVDTPWKIVFREFLSVVFSSVTLDLMRPLFLVDPTHREAWEKLVDLSLRARPCRVSRLGEGKAQAAGLLTNRQSLARCMEPGQDV